MRSRHGEIDQPFHPVDLEHDDLDFLAEGEAAAGLAADERGAGDLDSPARRATLRRMSKLASVQAAILELDPREREELRHWLDETAEETPEMLAAIDEGLRSLKAKGAIPLEDVRRDLRLWITKSA
jgi:hypothetical protein